MPSGERSQDRVDQRPFERLERSERMGGRRGLIAWLVSSLSPSLQIAELVDVCEHPGFVGFDGVAVHRVIGDEVLQSDCYVVLRSWHPSRSRQIAGTSPGRERYTGGLVTSTHHSHRLPENNFGSRRQSVNRQVPQSKHVCFGMHELP